MARFDARVPAPLRRLARRLARSLDVEGVYWGTRRRRGVWTDEPCLSVEVLVRGEPVRHDSTLDRRRHGGVLDIGLTRRRISFDGVVVEFARLIRVRVADGESRFGQRGDSGSLVVDREGEAIGVIVGVDTHSTFTYVLPLYGLYQEHPTIFSTFFS